MVLSIRTHSKSGVSAKAWKSLCHTPACDQRRKRAWTAVHLPSASGRSRQRAAWPAIHKIASTNPPVVHPAPPGRADQPGKMAFDPAPLLVRQCASAQGASPRPALNQKHKSDKIPQMQTAPSADRRSQRQRQRQGQGEIQTCGAVGVNLVSKSHLNAIAPQMAACQPSVAHRRSRGRIDCGKGRCAARAAARAARG
jgi:hypothetical protein